MTYLKLKYNCLAILVLAMFSGVLRAQDPTFSQFYSNHLYLNPAFAGSNKCPRININHRNQWPSLSAHFITSAVSFDTYVEGLHGGIGFYVMNDFQAISTLRTTNFAAMYAYQLNINPRFSLRFGLQAGIFQKSIDVSKLTFGDMIDRRRGFIYTTEENFEQTSRFNADFAAGVVGFSNKFYFGVAAQHLTQPNESVIGNNSPLPLKITAHFGAMLPTKKARNKFSKVPQISPNIIYQQQGPHQELNVGLYVINGIFQAGLYQRFSFRNPDAVIVLLGISTKSFKIGYSYDMTVSKLGISSGGSHEISLGFKFPCKVKRRTYRNLTCPSF